MNYHITNMPELFIRIISNLQVYQFVAKLLRHVFRYLIIVFRLKDNVHKRLVVSIRLLMYIE